MQLYDIMFFIRCLKTPDSSNTFPCSLTYISQKSIPGLQLT